MKKQDFSRVMPAVSIITCTKRARCMNTLFRNYSRQKYRNKELIIILNHNDLSLNDYVQASKSYPHVRIYRKPEQMPLGQCLNFGVQMAKYAFIAKFDDDDYYAPHYLIEAMRNLLNTKSDIAGKRAHYMYLRSRKLLLLRYSNMAHRTVPLVQGATLLVRRHVLHRVKFPSLNRGECVKFCADSLAKGYKIYSGSQYNFAAIRGNSIVDHTWKISDKQLMSRKGVKVLKVKNFKKYVQRSYGSTTK